MQSDILISFYSIINPIIQEYVPYNHAKNNSYPHWYSKDFRDTIRNKNHWHYQWIVNTDPKECENFKTLRSSSKKLIKSCFKSQKNKIENN